MKLCTKCKSNKPLSAFKADRRRRNGVAAKCRDCAALENRDWRKLHPEVDQNRTPRKRIRPTNKFATAKWRTRNPEQHRANDRAWRRANPEKARAIKATRLARKRGALGRHTGEQIKALFAAQKEKCAGCLKSIKGGYHVDHATPLALGGSNDIRNIQLLCATCNLAKHAKPPEIWAQENGRLL